MTSAALVSDVRPDPRDPRHRLSRLLDAGAAVPPPDDSGALVARGRIEGSPVLAYCTDATLMGGAMGADGCARIVEAIDTAVAERVPVIGVWHSGGARLAEGVSALHGVGTVFAAMVRASGKVPQVSVVVGPAAGGAAYGPALTDVVVMAGDGRVFVTGPDVIRTVTGEDVDAATLGGTDTHGRCSGVAHVTTADEAGAFVAARRIVAMAARPGRVRVPSTPGVDPGSLLPERPRRAYDVRPVVDALLDDGADDGVELAPRWAPNVVTRLGRLGGRAVGVVANNPLRLGGCLDSTSAEKAARFVRTCDSWGLPLVVLVDVPGYLPGVDQEFGGVVRRGAKLLHAFAEAVVPRVTVILRKSYGGAYVAMNSRSLGAGAVLAWPDAEVAVMAAAAAVPILHRRRLAAAAPDEREALLAELVADQERQAGGLARAAEIGVVDEVIAPAYTRVRIAEILAAAPAGRGRHGNIPL